MWKDKLKGLFKDVCREVEEACEDVKEKVEKAEIGDKLKKFGEDVKEEVEKAHIGETLKKVGEDIKEGVEKANIGEKLKKAGEEIKTQFTPSGAGQSTSATNGTTDVIDVPAVVIDATETVSQENAPEVSVEFEGADEECALAIPAEDGPRGELTCLNEQTYSYLLPKDPGFVDEGDCHAAEIHQAYGFGEEVNYERDAMIYYSIAPEFDCEITESRAKAAFTRYDSAPIRSKLMTVDHPVFTHVYLFETAKKYRLTYLKQIEEYELLGCELILRKSGGDDAWKAKMIEEFKRFAGSCREV